MKNLALFIVVQFVSVFSSAASLEIIDIKRNIPLSESEPVYKDFYIKLNGRSDLKKDLIVKAVRTIGIKDTSLKPVGDFKTPVGLVKIIQVSETIAVAREYKLTPRDEEAMIEQIGIMTGDEIDLAGSYMDEKK
jgi:hypothetical protein